MSLTETLTAQSPPLHIDCEGVVRIGATRVTLDTLVNAYESGATAEEIVQGYDSLELADVHAVISFYLRHRREVEQYLAQRGEQATRVRHENEERLKQQGLRQRLLMRRSQRS